MRRRSSTSSAARARRNARPWRDHRARAAGSVTVIDAAKARRLATLQRRYAELDKAAERAVTMVRHWNDKLHEKTFRGRGISQQAADWSAKKAAADWKLNQLQRARARVSNAIDNIAENRGWASKFRNPRLTRDQLAERAYKLHQAVSRGLHRTKGRPSARQIAIEKAYARTVALLEFRRRANPMARRRRTRSGRFAKGRRNPKRAVDRRTMPMTFPSPPQRAPRNQAAAQAAAQARTAAATAVRTFGTGMPYVNRFGPAVGGPSIKAISVENNKSVIADGEFAKFLTTGDGRRWLKSKEGKAWASAQQAKKDEAAKAAKEAKKATQAAVRAAKKASAAATPAGAKAAAKTAKKAATKAKKAVKKAKKATAAVKKSAKGGAKGKKVKRSGGASRSSEGGSVGQSKKRRKGKKGGGGGGKKRRGGGRRGRHISAAHRRKMNAGRARYWARQRKMGGAPSRLRRKLRAAIKAHPPLSKAERAFRKTNPRRRRNGRRRRNPSALLVNPRRRRNPAMKRRKRNPGLGGVVQQVIKTGGPALATAAALGALDVKVFSEKPAIVGILAKLGVGVGALIGLRSKPQYAVPIACAAFAAIGNDLGVRMVKGIVGGSREATAKQLGQIAAEDEETFGVLLTEMQGLGILSVEGVGSPVDDAAAAFEGTEALDVGDF